jgi:hypothetical protein
MANLIPLTLDKDSGRLVAKDIIGTGSGPIVPVGTFAAYGYIFIEMFAATTWNIVHNLGYDKALVQIYDTNGEFILPNSIDIVDGNQIVVNFGSSQDGYAHIIFIDDTT